MQGLGSSSGGYSNEGGIMPIVTIFIVIVVCGLIWWMVDALLPIPPVFKTVLKVLIILFLCIWLLSIVGAFGHLGSLRIGR